MYVNKDLKKVMIDSVPGDQIPNLLIRCSLSIAKKIAICCALNQFKLSTVAMMNMSPIFTMIMSFCFLMEDVGCTDVVQMVLSFTAMNLVVVGMFDTKESLIQPTMTIKDDPLAYARVDHVTMRGLLILITIPIA